MLLQKVDEQAASFNWMPDSSLIFRPLSSGICTLHLQN